MQKVVAFNCSPRMEKGNTALVLNPFVDGMRSAGASVELLYTKKLNILPCTGEFTCWSDQSSGVCHLKDDCSEVLDKMRRADVWIFGVPVYAKLPGELQNLFNRTMPLLEPPPIVRGRMIVPSRRKDVRLGKVGLVSTCSYWGLENFELLVKTVEFMAKAFGAPFGRPVLRPQADLLTDTMRLAPVAEAAKHAGEEFIREGDVSLRTARAVQRQFTSKKESLENG